MELWNPPQPAHEEETLDAFLIRLTKAYDYESKLWFLDYINLPYYTDPNKIASEIVFSQLSELCQIEKHRLLKMTINKYLSAFLSQNEINQSIISQWSTTKFPMWDRKIVKRYYSRKSCTFCPHCYNQFGTSLLPWKFAIVTTCDAHKCILIDRCPKCGSREINFAEGICINCEMPIKEMPTIEIVDSQSSLSLSFWVQKIFEIDKEFPFSQNFEQKEFHVGPISSAASYIYFLYNFNKLLLNFDPENSLWENSFVQKNNFTKPYKLPQLDIVTRHQLFRSGNDLLLDWPESFFSTLDRIAWYQNHHYTNSEKRQFYFFTTAMRKLFKVENYDWLWSSWVDFISDSPDKSRLPYEWISYLNNIPENITKDTGHNSLTKAAKLTRIHRTTLLRNITAGNLKYQVDIKQSDRFVASISNLAIEKIIETRKNEITITKVSECLGVSRKIIKDCVRLHLLGATARSYRQGVKCLFTQSDIDAFLQNIISHTTVKAMFSEGGISLIHAPLIFYRMKIGVAEIIKDILAGKTIAYFDPVKKNLQGVWFSRQEIALYKESVIYGGESPYYTFNEALQKLKVDSETMKDICRSNILTPINNQDDDILLWKFNQEATNKLIGRYISAYKAGQIIGHSRTVVLSFAHKGYLNLVSSNSCNDGHFCRFDREYVIEWRKGKLSHDEVLEILGVSYTTLRNLKKDGTLVPMIDSGSGIIFYDKNDVLLILEQRRSNREKEKAFTKPVDQLVRDIRSCFLAHKCSFSTLTDEQWLILENLFPEKTDYKNRPKVRINNRRILDTLLQAAHDNVQLRHLPKKFSPSARTCYRRINKWMQAGKLSEIKESLIEIISENLAIQNL
jgi:hypothetical protein